MNRNLGIERVYNLGDYKSLRVSDTVENLPEEFVTNVKAVDLVRYLQLLNADLVYERYMDLIRRTDNLTVRERVSTLIEERSNTMEQLKELLTSKGEN